MKKVILVATIGVLALISCKKDYTCSCTVTSTGLVNFTVVNDTIYQDVSKSDAENKCATMNSSASGFGTTVTSVCEIK